MELKNPLNKINIILLSFVGAINLLSLIQTANYEKIINICIYIPIIIFLIIVDKKENIKIITACVYFVISMVICFMGSVGNWSGAGVLFCSIYLDNKKTKNIIKCLALLVCLTATAVIKNFTTSELSGLILMNGAHIVIFYFCFMHPKNKYDIKDDQTKQIIELIEKDNSRKEIAEKVFMNVSAVNKRIARITKEKGFKNTEAFLMSLIRQDNKDSDKFRNQ